MEPSQSNRARSLGKLGELLVIGGVAAEMIAAHLYSFISAIVPAAPTSSVLSFCGAVALLSGLILEWIAHRSAPRIARQHSWEKATSPLS